MFALVFITTLCDWLKNSRHFLSQSAVRPISDSLARTRFHAVICIFLILDWFVKLFAFFVIVQRDLVWPVGFTTLN